MRLWSWLSRLWRRRPPHGPLEVILHTRQGCHLCETAHEQLETARRRWGFHLSIVDVDSDPRLVQEHGECVPVVTIAGRIRFRGRINEVLLNRMLRGEQRASPS